MNYDYENAKMAGVPRDMAKNPMENLQQAQTAAAGLNSSYRPSMREEAEKSIAHNLEQAERSKRALTFFQEHPEFDEFIGLIRSGVIRI